MNYLENIEGLLLKTGIHPLGCSFDEILHMELNFGIVFPKAYKEFLYLMGHNSDDFICGDTSDYINLKYIQEEAQEIYERSMRKKLPPNLFIFSTHQNYSFYAFDLNKEENPPLKLFVIGDGEEEAIDLRIEHPNISTYLYKEITTHFRIM